MTVTWGWTASHPLTGREVDTETLGEAVAWFCGRCIESWLRRHVAPYVLYVVVVSVVVWRGVRS